MPGSLLKRLPVLCLLSLSCSKKSDPAPIDTGTTVAAQISDVSQSRKDTASTLNFYVKLNTTSSQTISIHYTTVEATAKANKDFVPVSGVLTLQPNQKDAFIQTKITGDSLRQNDQQFYLQLSDPVNCTLANNKATATIVNDGTYLPVDNTGYTTPDHYAGYTLAWSDEFNETSLDDAVWTFETGGSGWGNNELENYTGRTQNAFLSQGNLVIEARKEKFGGNDYTSARLITSGKKTFKYGRIDIRAKLPVQTGMWPALWMLGNNITQAGWPACGEIDIMELVGSAPNKVTGTGHWASATGSDALLNNSYTLGSGDFSQQFHVFSLVWKENSLQWYVDDHLYHTLTSANVGNVAYPFNSNFFFILNVAVGGNWPGPPDQTTTFPQRMIVDYIRVFQ